MQAEKRFEIRICKNRYKLGKSAAKFVAHAINEAIAEKANAEIALSTGASQFDTLNQLCEILDCELSDIVEFVSDK